MSELDDLLDQENVKDLIDTTVQDVDNIGTIIIAYTRKNGSLHWRSNCKRSEGLGLLDVVHYDLLILKDTVDDDQLSGEGSE